METLAPLPKPDNPSVSADPQRPAAEKKTELNIIRLPSLDNATRCAAFTTLDISEKPFFPDMKVHTNFGQEVRELSQREIHFASKDYRLRSDHLAQTLRLFGHKVSDCLPDGFCVQVGLSSAEGTGACDTVTLIHHSPDGAARAILEQHYLPFNGGGIGSMVPTDEAKNTILTLEERLFYYKTLLAIKTAISNTLSRPCEGE